MTKTKVYEIEDYFILIVREIVCPIGCVFDLYEPYNRHYVDMTLQEVKLGLVTSRRDIDRLETILEVRRIIMKRFPDFEFEFIDGHGYLFNFSIDNL